MAARVTPLVLSLMVASSLMSPKCLGQAETRTSFRSTPLGIALELPEGWRAIGAAQCGTGLIGKSERELRQMPRLVQSFHNEKFDLYLRLSVIQEIVPERIQEHERWLSSSSVERIWEPFQFAGGQVGRRLRCVLAASVDPPAEANTRFTYVLIAGVRRFELSGYCRSSQVHKYLPVFDAVARSIEVSEQTVDRPTAGTWKTGRRLGVRFEYPGDWEWVRPWDDAMAARSDSFQLRGPGHEDRRHDSPPRVSISRGPAEKGFSRARDSWEGELRQMCERMNATGNSSATLSPYQNAAGHKGWRVDMCTGGGARAWTTWIVIFPAPKDEWVTVQCSAGSEETKRWSDVLDRIAASVEVE